MKKFEFSDEVKLIIQYAQETARSNFHSTCTTSHCFLAAIKVLKITSTADNADPKFAEYLKKFVEIINNHGLNGELYKEAFTTQYPSQTPKAGETFVVNCASDIQKVIENLTKIAARDKRQIGIADFIREMFSDRSYDVRATIELAIASTQETDAIANEMIDYFKKQVPQMTSIKDFEKVNELTNLNEYVMKKKMTFVNTDSTVDQIRLALSCKSINSAALVGKAGTGKTMSVYAFCDAINRNECPGFNNKIVYQLDMSSVVSGTRFRGDFEEKLLNIVNLAKKYRNQVILFIDEMHNIVGSGASSEGSMDGANILKPYITRGDIQIIGATTSEEYAKYIEKDKAFARRFQKIHISEPSKEDTYKILLGLKPEYDEFFGKTASEDLVKSVVDISMKYNVDQANPARSIGMLDLAYAHSKVFNENNELVMSDDVLEAIRIKYDLIINENRTDATLDELKREILGQDEIIKKIGNQLKYIEKGLVDPEKPLFSAILAGPTGTGKTQSARIIAKHFFGSENNLIKINMGEYGSEMDASRISGASAGYVGYDDEPDLVKSIKQYPASVVLFDEIEKANKKVFDTLLSILDTGEMKTNKGDVVSFKNAIILFTTNLGYEAGFSEQKGLGFVKSSTQISEVIETIKQHFRPEFINRLDEIIVYNGLTNKIADTLIDRYVKEFEEISNTTYRVTKKSRDAIKKDANIEEYGARGLKRAVRRELLNIATKKSR